jgi:CMP-N,N'-diacetyllegionaminic acid synthase
MIDGRRVLAVVPARGGSKGIYLKNLCLVGGIPLVSLVGRVIQAVPEIDRAIVSTDHTDIARVAKDAGIAAPFMRPEDLSGDRIGDLEVLSHALQTMERLDGVAYDIVVMLQPTSPLREPEHVSSCITMLVAGAWDSVWTVSETDTKAHPLKQLTVAPDDALDYWDHRGAQIIARQQLAPVYHRNGIAYAITRECLLNQKTIKGSRTGALVIKGLHVSIDTESDLELVNWLLQQNSAEILSR